VRRAPSVLLQTRTRLACVKHAASVRSEPGSNSRLKLVAWRKKMPGFAPEPACQANYCRSIYSDHSCSKRTNGFERILAHRIGCQRACPPCLAERHIHSPRRIRQTFLNVNTILVISTGIHRGDLAACLSRSRCLSYALGGPTHAPKSFASF
jgi:hypothetical protein